jgi:coronin-1B/1C/6
MRAFKTVNDSYIEPISFTVPRRAETFQSDIFPPAVGLKPGATTSEWLSGKTALPPKIDFESIYEGNAPVEVPSNYKAPAPVPSPAPVAKPAHKPEPVPVATRSPPPSMRDQKQSMAAMASKYEDDEVEEDDGESSFEEISKPVQRSTMPASAQPKAASPTKTTSAPPPKPAAAPLKSPSYAPSPAATTPTSTSHVSNGVESSLDQIKQLLEVQTKMISSQGQQISHLTAEVESLKKRVGSGSQDQSEQIRKLELELESLRS